jgi:hypothetical protein
MTTPAHHLASPFRRGIAAARSIYERLNLEDDRIMIDIETEMALSQIEYKIEKPTRRLHQFLLQGSTLGPLSVLLFLAVYLFLSPLLSPAVHEYISHILH